jgi:hypothetical protein
LTDLVRSMSAQISDLQVWVQSLSSQQASAPSPPPLPLPPPPVLSFADQFEGIVAAVAQHQEKYINTRVTDTVARQQDAYVRGFQAQLDNLSRSLYLSDFQHPKSGPVEGGEPATLAPRLQAALRSWLTIQLVRSRWFVSCHVFCARSSLAPETGSEVIVIVCDGWCAG